MSGSPTDWKGVLIAQATAAVQAQLNSAIATAVVSVLSTVTVLQPSDLLSAQSTPPILAPAQGDGKMIQALFATLEYNPVSTDYTLGDIADIYIGPQGNPTTQNVLQPVPATLLDGSGGPGSVISLSPPVNVITAQKAIFNNLPLVLSHDGSVELLNGDGTLTVTLYYICTSCR